MVHIHLLGDGGGRGLADDSRRVKLFITVCAALTVITGSLGGVSAAVGPTKQHFYVIAVCAPLVQQALHSHAGCNLDPIDLAFCASLTMTVQSTKHMTQLFPLFVYSILFTFSF